MHPQIGQYEQCAQLRCGQVGAVAILYMRELVLDDAEQACYLDVDADFEALVMYEN